MAKLESEVGVAFEGTVTVMVRSPVAAAAAEVDTGVESGVGSTLDVGRTVVADAAEALRSPVTEGTAAAEAATEGPEGAETAASVGTAEASLAGAETALVGAAAASLAEAETALVGTSEASPADAETEAAAEAEVAAAVGSAPLDEATLLAIPETVGFEVASEVAAETAAEAVAEEATASPVPLAAGGELKSLGTGAATGTPAESVVKAGAALPTAEAAVAADAVASPLASAAEGLADIVALTGVGTPTPSCCACRLSIHP